ncbi:MAG TPA: hypothetical protein VHI13_20130 [Candidatus Kapabacteria bacterium]|nr:hypothetical protein [Candidatus Kapabacteria bacterium]
MKRPNDLFRLIKSMSKAEKRYFKLYASKHIESERNNSVRLFDAIDAQAAYDQESIRRRFAGERFSRQLAVQKNYLYRVILKSLRAFHAEASPAIRIGEMMHTVEILANRGLYDQCVEILSAARHLALEHEEYALALKVQELEGRVAYSINDTGRLHHLQSEQDELTGLMANIADYRRLSQEMNEVVIRYGGDNHVEVRARAEAILASDLLRDEALALSRHARIRLHSLRMLCLSYCGDAAGSHRALRNCIEAIEAFPDPSPELQFRLLVCRAVALGIALAGSRFTEMDQDLEALKALRSGGLYMDHNVDLVVHRYTLARHIRTGAFDCAREEAPLAEAILRCPDPDIRNNLGFAMRFDLAHLYFICREFGRALDHVNAMLMAAPANARAIREMTAAWLFGCILHFERGDMETMLYMVNGARRFMTRAKQKPKACTLFLGFLRRLANVVSASAVPAEVRRFHGALERNGVALAELRPYMILDVEAWMAALLERKEYGASYLAMCVGR